MNKLISLAGTAMVLSPAATVPVGLGPWWADAIIGTIGAGTIARALIGPKFSTYVSPNRDGKRLTVGIHRRALFSKWPAGAAKYDTCCPKMPQASHWLHVGVVHVGEDQEERLAEVVARTKHILDEFNHDGPELEKLTRTARKMLS